MAAQRILLIEDETGARTALASLLVDDGYLVCTAENGTSGLCRAREFDPDTIICDFSLPDITGLQVLQWARSEAERDIVFVLVTAGCGGEPMEGVLRREADFFFHKPIDLRAFREVLETAMTPTSRTSAFPPLLDSGQGCT